jgi:hypothetical protein
MRVASVKEVMWRESWGVSPVRYSSSVAGPAGANSPNSCDPGWIDAVGVAFGRVLATGWSPIGEEKDVWE